MNITKSNKKDFFNKHIRKNIHPLNYQRDQIRKIIILLAVCLVGAVLVTFGPSLVPGDKVSANTTVPELTYSTFFGGSSAESGRGMAVDSSGNIYVTGVTNSADFPQGDTQNIYGSTANDGAFVAKFTPGGNLLWTTLIGGSATDMGIRMAVDDLSENVYVAGATSSTDFHTTDGTNGNGSTFLLKLDADSGVLVFSSIVGNGAGFRNNIDVAVDSANNIYLTSKDSVSNDAFVAKYTQSAIPSAPLNESYKTFIGGSGSENAHGMAVDSSGRVFVTGVTDSPDFLSTINPPTIGFQPQMIGLQDTFVVALDQTGAITYGTYLGGDESPGIGGEAGNDIAVDDLTGLVYVTGGTNANDFFTTNGAFDSTYNGGTDVFLTVLNPNQSGSSSLFYSTFFGGSSDENALSVEVDVDGNAYVFGRIWSKNLPGTPNTYDPTYNGKQDVFLAKFNPDEAGADSLIASTYFGGKGTEADGDLVLTEISGDVSVYLTGRTGSRNDFPFTSGAYDETYNGGQNDVFISIMKFGQVVTPPTVSINSPADGASFASGVTISFAGTANDSVDGDLTGSLTWTSDIDGEIGTGGSFQTTLSDGVHTIIASATNSGGSTGSDSIIITVGSANTITVQSITYSTTGGKNSDKHLVITVQLDPAVGGASVSLRLERNGNLAESFTGVTDSSGKVEFTHQNAADGTYTSVITEVTTTGYIWDTDYPPNSYSHPCGVPPCGGDGGGGV